MKKTLIAIALAAAVVPAWGEAVVSSNIVGYEKIEVPVNKMDIVGVQFQGVGTNVVDIQSITVEEWDGYGSDWIKIYNPTSYTYTTAYYWGDDMGGVSDEDGNELGPGWGDVDQIAINMSLQSGQAIWTQSEAGGKFVVSGEVTTDNAVEVPVNKMTLVANPLPMTISLQDIRVNGWDGYGSDWIKIYNPATYTYTTAYYWGDDMGGVSDEDGNELGPGWGDVDQIAIEADIEVGQGFWVQSEAGGSLIFPAIPAN